jgi:hypothetical protein
LIHRITYYAAKKNFWIYLPTNARLLRTDVIDKLTDSAAIGTFRNVIVALLACNLLKMWWPETGSNRRRRPFQGRALPLSYLALA